MWFAAFTAVPVTFSVGFIAGCIWRQRLYERSLEAILTEEVLRAGLEPTPQPTSSLPSGE